MPFANCPVEAYPDVTNVSVQIITFFPGHAAEEVERLVTIPIENVMNGIPKRVSMRSISLFGLSQITLVFEDDAKNEVIRNLASQLLATANLPPGVQPGLSPDATPIGEVYRYTLRAPAGYPPEELRALEDWVVEKKFRSVPGGGGHQSVRRADQAVSSAGGPAQAQVLPSHLAASLHRAGQRQRQRRRLLRRTRLRALRRARPGHDRQRGRHRGHRRGHPQRHPHSHPRHWHGRHRPRRPPRPRGQDRGQSRRR